jgi:hypothetical protein
MATNDTVEEMLTDLDTTVLALSGNIQSPHDSDVQDILQNMIEVMRQLARRGEVSDGGE